MDRLLLRGGRIAIRGGSWAADVLCEDGRIAMVAPGIVAEAVVVDASGLLLGPGFVDIHVHGGGGQSFFEPGEDAIRGYARWAPRNGVTSFLVSTVGRDADDTVRLLASQSGAIGSSGGAEPLGFHLEGPFINPVRKGAFPSRTLRAPSVPEFERFQSAARGAIRQVTLAPELPGGLDLVAAVTRSGAVAAMGHTDASTTEVLAGIDAGVRHVTHLFNAMRPIHQRDGGPAVTAMLDRRVTCELISDGAHVAPEVLRMAYGLLGSGRAVVVTDNMYLAGTGGETGRFAGSDVRVDGAKASKEDGTIVGSVATMDQHFRNAMDFLAVDAATAFALCSTNPAGVIGVDGRKGRIAVGMDADITGVDAGGNVALTVCRGAVAFRRNQ